MACILGAWWLCLVPAYAQDDAEHLAELEWQIPITLTEPIRKEAQSLTLYVSADQGKTWKKQTNAKPTDEFFKYTAPGDGVYWFSVSFVNKAGQTVPARDADLQPQLKIVVDLKKPDVKLAAQDRQNDQVNVSWDVKDDHLDLNTLTLQYKAKTESAWKAVALSPLASGKKQFSVGTAGPVSVRLSVKDKAGNTGEEMTDIQASTVVTAHQPQATGTLTSNQGQPGAPTPPAPPALSASNPPLFGQTPPVAAQTPPTAAGTATAGLPTAPPSLPVNPLANQRLATDSGFKPAPTFSHTPSHSNVGSGGGYVGRSRTQPGPVQWTNSMHLDLDFNVKTGPSGIGVIELYYTLDGGKTWQLFDKREDAKSPFSIDVPAEGIYGFTMVVKNKVGMGRAAPQPGEAPDIRIGVDVTAPVCELITPVEAVPGRKDVVNLKWTAIDNNLTSTPIRLEWAENATGPWHSVVERSANTGNHLWRVPTQGLPPQVFLKLDVTDMAGNVGTFVTREPVIVDLQEPEIQIKGLVNPKR
jgi:hypothetical protein